MELSVYFKSIIDQDICPIVICNLSHEIIYMNPEAVERYAKRGGIELIGKSLLNCHNEDSNSKIKKSIGSVQARKITEFLLFIIRKKIKTFIWSLLGMITAF